MRRDTARVTKPRLVRFSLTHPAPHSASTLTIERGHETVTRTVLRGADDPIIHDPEHLVGEGPKHRSIWNAERGRDPRAWLPATPTLRAHTSFAPCPLDGVSFRAMADSVEAFISRWSDIQGSGGERANFQSFVRDLVEILDLPRPDPASDDTRDNAYVFERRVRLKQIDGSESYGFIDLYKRGSFVCEAKQTGKDVESSGWDKAMIRAHSQADRYIRALPADEGRPPFLIVVDVGKSIELYSEFSRSGATYTPFPDARSHRIRLDDLEKPEIQDRLRRVWLDPLSLDPSRKAARVTREIAASLAKLAKSLEAKGHDPEAVATFLMRTMFAMFAEDVGLIPHRSFTELLEGLRGERVRTFVPMVEGLFREMNTGGFSVTLREDILRFNGGLFSEAHAIAIDRDQLDLLIEAAHADWRFVEPAIFGTLLERALDPRERHKLGAHYTPRAYVERLILPTVIEPLREEFRAAQIEAHALESQGKMKEAREAVIAFHRRLSSVRVLDPACGSANFLYVTLEHMKRLEGEVLNLLHDMGVSQTALELEGETFAVTPDQFLGIEINPRAARIAEMVLWIGYLQWHFRTRGETPPPEPILRDFKNIENRDALIEYDAEEPVLDAEGQPVTRWDGVTFKKHPVTGEDVPDESAQAVQYRYVNPRKASWPEAEFIVGNPPFIGAGGMRRALGGGYVDAVRKTYPEIAESTDFVMYWWHIAAEKVRSGKAQRFGFITTNSLKQTFNRRVVLQHLEAKPPLSLAFAIPDHPWVDAADGAAVRISMTVGDRQRSDGRLLRVRSEVETRREDEIEVEFSERSGTIFSDLRIGADVASAKRLTAASMISSPGVKLHGSGFIVTAEQAAELGLGRIPGLDAHIRQYRNGRDLTSTPRGVLVIDLYGLEIEEVRRRFPDVYQWVLQRVKPERDQNNRPTYRDNWWIFGEARRDWRQYADGLSRFITTVETTKHRVFQFLPATILPDNMLVNIALEDAVSLGVLSSRLHVAWALAAGGRLGVGNDPRYNKTRCFETYPFPHLTLESRETIGNIAEEIDALRKRQQESHPEVTLTGVYNVLEKLRAGEALTKKEREIHDKGLVSVLRELHDKLDEAVFEAYGWEDLGKVLVGRPGATTPLIDKPEDQAEAEEDLLQRLVALNHERAREEAEGRIRYLRPEYQAPESAPAATQVGLEGIKDDKPKSEAKSTQPAKKLTWPKVLAEQITAVQKILEEDERQSAEAIASRFKRSPVQAVQSVLDALEALGFTTR